MTYYVFSTMAQDTAYTFYKPLIDKNDLHEIERQIKINGGANVANKNFITPRGAVTKITDEEYQALSGHFDFKLHVKNGFLIAQKSKSDIEDVVTKMSERDKSAPMRPDDCHKFGGAKPMSAENVNAYV